MPALIPSGAQSPEAEAPPAFSLWLPRDMAITSVLLGFPGAFGLAARNFWRLGQHRNAWLILVGGILAFGAISFGLPAGRPAGVVVALNVAIVVLVYLVMRRQVAGVERGGGAVTRAPGAAGLATFVGGWVVTVAPTVVLSMALVFLGAQVHGILGGTMQFGTAGSGCTVEGAATVFPSTSSIHYVAYLNRHVQPGETITLDVRTSNAALFATDQLAASSSTDCVSGTLPPGTIPEGHYSWSFTVGAERVASGEIVISP
jgi:hypothetical protein